MENTIDINPIPYLTWTWLKINKDTVSYDFALTENNGTETKLPEGISANNGKSISTKLSEPEFSIGEQAENLISNAASKGKIYTIEKSPVEPLIIRIKLDSNSATHQIIHAKAGTTANIIIVYESGSEVSSLSGVITKVYAADRADFCSRRKVSRKINRKKVSYAVKNSRYHWCGPGGFDRGL